jgi:hypothetical protein
VSGLRGWAAVRELLSQSSSVSAAATPTTSVVVSGKRRRRPLRTAQGECGRKDGVFTRLPAPKTAPAETSPGQEKHCGPRRPHRKGSVHDEPHLHSIRHSKTDSAAGCPRRLPALSQLVPKCRWWILNHRGLRRVDTPAFLPGLIPPSRGSSAASCPQKHYPVRSWPRLCGLGQFGEKPCGWPVGILTAGTVPQWARADICFPNETHLESGQALRFANYVCHRTDRKILGGGTAILVRRDIDHHAVPASGLQHLETTATYLMLATRTVERVSAYL